MLVSKIFKMLFLLLLFFLLYNSSWLWTGAFSSFSSCLLRGPRRASPVFLFRSSLNRKKEKARKEKSE